MEQNVVSGIAYAKDEAKITLLQIDDKPGVAAAHLRARSPRPASTST